MVTRGEPASMRLFVLDCYSALRLGIGQGRDDGAALIVSARPLSAAPLPDWTGIVARRSRYINDAAREIGSWRSSM